MGVDWPSPSVIVAFGSALLNAPPAKLGEGTYAPSPNFVGGRLGWGQRCYFAAYFLFNRIGIVAFGSALLNDPSSLPLSTNASPSNMTVAPFAVCL